MAKSSYMVKYSYNVTPIITQMPQREFEITIGPDGGVELHVKGYKGKSCLEVMKIFEQVVGELKDRRETSEFYEPDENVQINLEQRH